MLQQLPASPSLCPQVSDRTGAEQWIKGGGGLTNPPLIHLPGVTVWEVSCVLYCYAICGHIVGEQLMTRDFRYTVLKTVAIILSDF